MAKEMKDLNTPLTNEELILMEQYADWLGKRLTNLKKGLPLDIDENKLIEIMAFMYTIVRDRKEFEMDLQRNNNARHQ